MIARSFLAEGEEELAPADPAAHPREAVVQDAAAEERFDGLWDDAPERPVA